MEYNRNFSQLQQKAVLWWPQDIADKNRLANILPLLLQTQDKFLSILNLVEKFPEQVFVLIEASSLSANLFLKHLAVLADYGGEMMKRLGSNFTDIFPKDNRGYYMDYFWHSQKYYYHFKSFGTKEKTVISNDKLFISQDHILHETAMTEEMRDMIMILLYASTSSVSEQAGLEACEIGTILGNANELKNYIKQRYIIVSRIIGGCKANDLGQTVQTVVCDYLKKKLDGQYTITRNGKVILTEYDKVDGLPFDVVVTKGTKHIGIEISFQVTTNSTIERKSGQAANRQQLMHNAHNYIAYIIDGAGNFQRNSALSTICNHSDCTVAFSEEEFDILIRWIKEIL